MSGESFSSPGADIEKTKDFMAKIDVLKEKLGNEIVQDVSGLIKKHEEDEHRDFAVSTLELKKNPLRQQENIDLLKNTYGLTESHIKLGDVGSKLEFSYNPNHTSGKKSDGYYLEILWDNKGEILLAEIGYPSVQRLEHYNFFKEE